MAPSTVATPRAPASGRKRKAEAVASPSKTPASSMRPNSSKTPPVEMDAKRKYHDVEKEILECPICLEQFTPPVFQCQNGHAICSACRAKIRECPSCSQPVGTFIRNLLAEKIVESLQVRCPYTHHGCKQVVKVKDAEEHRRSLCAYRPCPCPVPGCIHAGPKQTLPLHLEKEHKVLTYDPAFARWRFGLESSDQSRFVILKNLSKAQLLLHREVIEGLGEIFFCTKQGSVVIASGGY